MGKSIREAARAQELEPASVGQLIHQYVGIAIETAVREELRAALGTNPYERTEVRRGYRNGTKARTLTGPTGPIALSAPCHPLQWREGIDVGHHPALSAADAGSE